MRPKFYLDIMICPGDAGANWVRSRIIQKLHGFFGHNKENGECKYAIAFPIGGKDPNGNEVLRVFASTPEDISHLEECLKQIPICRDYASITVPAEVPNGFNGTWTRYRKYKIPTASSDRHACNGQSELRDRRIHDAKASRLQYFILRSSTSGSIFTLWVKVESDSSPAAECLPDCYGLSVSSRPFALPDLKWTH